MRIRSIMLAGIAMAGLVAAAGLPALAADYPVLRGSQIEDAPPAPSDLFGSGPTNWTGFYLGGFGGYSDTNFGVGRGAANLVANYLRQTTIEAEMNASSLLNMPNFSKRSNTFGGFGGYNWQFGSAVVGFEADYSRYDVSGSSSDAIGRVKTLSDGYIGTIGLTGKTAARIDDISTLRIRAGYAIGEFMPFITGGLAYGRGSVTSSATIKTSYVDADPTTAPDLPPINNATETVSSNRKNSSMLGGTVGVGVEALFGGLLLRAEANYVRMEAQGNVVVETTTARVGAGVKF